ncbi:MAG: PKD domain-containing protein [Thermoplasmata archaeon]|nr:MAG: PKD domain-containing protein [Thermoplasmata archaeon]
MMKKIMVLLVVGMLAVLPAQITGLSQPFPVYGYIKDSDGNAVANAAVYVRDVSKSTYIVVYTDSRGYYQANLYDLENCENGDTINVSCSYNNEINYVIFVLDVTETSKNISFNLIGSPVIHDNGAYDITSSSAKIDVDIDDLVGDSYCKVWVEYGTTTSYGSVTAKQTVYSPSTISFTLNGLKPDKTYHYRIVAKNSRKIAYTGDATFTTQAKPPQVTTMSATNVRYSEAKLRGYLNEVGSQICEVWFVYDTSYHSNWQDYAYSTTHKNLTSPTSFSRLIQGLQINTTYHFRAVAKNKAGISYGNDMTFTTHVVTPDVVTKQATNVTASSATLNGEITDLGGVTSCQVWFEYGATTSYGSVTPVMNATSAFSIEIDGLQPGKTYHYRAVAKNKAGISYGNDMTFTTTTLKANVSTKSVNYAVVLNGEVTDLGGDTSCYAWFEYGATTSYGNVTNKVVVTQPGSFSVIVTGLEENKTYHYRAVVQNSKGISYGGDMTFRMLSLPSPPIIETMNASIDASNETVILRGNISSLNGNSYCYAWFEYWKEGGIKHTTSVRIIDHECEINETITTGIGNYTFQLIAVGSEGGTAYGGLKSFMVTREYNHAPSIVALYPENDSVAGMNVSLGVRIEDADNDSLILTFYWRNGSVIKTMECYNGIYAIALHNLSYNGYYSWYASVSDGMAINTTPVMHFWTQKFVNADFYWQPSVVTEGEIVQFFDNSTGATSWLWNFGDGNTSNESNPSHVFKAGVYSVTLTAYDENGSFDFITKQIHVYMLGDANMDDRINALDVTKIELLIKEGEYSKVADVDRNGIINGKDIERVIEIIVG